MEWLVGDLRLARRWVVSDSSITIPGSSHIENSKVVDVIEQAWGHYVLSLFKLLLRGSFNDSYTQWALFSTCEMKCHSRADKAKKRKSRAWLILFICTTWQRFFHSLVQLVEFFIDLVLFTFWAETVQFHSCLGREDRNSHSIPTLSSYFTGFRGRGWTGLAFTCWEKESGSGYDWGWG